MPRSALLSTLAGCLVAACVFIVPLDGRGQARERVIYAGLVDGDTRAPVTDATAASFVIREDGVQREILRVVPATSPMAIAIVVDNSQAAAPTIAELRTALSAFLTAIDGLGPVALVTIADRPTIVADYTTSLPTLQQAAQRLFHVPGSGATLLDSLRDVARGLGRREEDRAALVVVATENIEFSTLTYRSVLEAIDESGAAMHAVVLVNPDASVINDEARNRAAVLDRGPKESGGTRRNALTSMSYEPYLKTLAAQLRHQYRVTYARPPALIPPEKIEISATAPGLEAYGAPARGQAAQ